MKVYIVTGVDECCSLELKAFKTKVEAEKYVEKMNNSPDNCMLWWDTEEVEVTD